MPTMYDRLGDLLNETLEAGEVKFIRIDKNGKISEADAKESNEKNDDRSTKEENKSDNNHKLKKEYVIYKKITPEIERCYRLLDVSISANLDDIKKAYKEKIKYYHPDRHADNPVLLKVSTDKTRQIVEAYKMLVEFIGK